MNGLDMVKRKNVENSMLLINYCNELLYMCRICVIAVWTNTGPIFSYFHREAVPLILRSALFVKRRLERECHAPVKKV